MFTAIFVTRLIFDIYSKYFHIKSLKMHKLLTNMRIPFLKLWKYSVTISIILIVTSSVVVGIRHKHIWGVDFTGGSQIIMNYKTYVSQNNVKSALISAGYEADVSYKSSPVEGNKLEVLISDQTRSKTGSGDLNNVLLLFNSKFPDVGFTGASETIIGGFVGAQFAKSAVLAVILSYSPRDFPVVRVTSARPRIRVIGLFRS